jgi:hypothetical protein
MINKEVLRGACLVRIRLVFFSFIGIFQPETPLAGHVFVDFSGSK